MRADASDDFEGHDRRPHTTSRPAELNGRSQVAPRTRDPCTHEPRTAN